MIRKNKGRVGMSKKKKNAVTKSIMGPKINFLKSSHVFETIKKNSKQHLNHKYFSTIDV